MDAKQSLKDIRGHLRRAQEKDGSASRVELISAVEQLVRLVEDIEQRPPQIISDGGPAR